VPQNESIGKRLNLWTQTVAIIIGGIWAVNTFWYKEIKVPSTTPVNIVVDIGLKVGSPRKQNSPNLIPLEVVASAKNVGGRDVYLLPSMFAGYGWNIVAKSSDVPVGTTFGAKSALEFWDAAAQSPSRDLVAAGWLFLDDYLRPSEAISRKFVVFVDRAKYDVAAFQIVVPSTTKKDVLEVEWSIRSDSHFDEHIYKIAKDKSRVDISPENVEAGPKKSLELQYSRSLTQIALW